MDNNVDMYLVAFCVSLKPATLGYIGRHAFEEKEKHLENPPDKKIHSPLVTDQCFAVIQSEIRLI